MSASRGSGHKRWCAYDAAGGCEPKRQAVPATWQCNSLAVSRQPAWLERPGAGRVERGGNATRRGMGGVLHIGCSGCFHSTPGMFWMLRHRLIIVPSRGTAIPQISRPTPQRSHSATTHRRGVTQPQANMITALSPSLRVGVGKANNRPRLADARVR